MSEKWKQKTLLIFPFAVLAAGMILTAAFFLHTYRQIAFEHTSALCETILENSPEAEPQLLAALKDYHSLTEQELRDNDYLEKYGYRADDFCYDFPLDTVLFPIIFFLVTACAFGAGIFLSRRKNRKRIDDLTEYLEQINIGAGGTLIQTKEDEYSHLQDEIYKTVTMLYQTRETAVAAKKNFAENLAFWEWAEQHRSFIDFSKLEPLALGKEPDWVAEQRRKDYQSFALQRKDPWSPDEDNNLIRLLKQQKYGYAELSEILRRSEGAIVRRCRDLGLKERPVIADPHRKGGSWSDEQHQILADGIRHGDSYSMIGRVIGKSEKALRGKIYFTYLTEDADKVRAMLGDGPWGHGAPEPTVRQGFSLSKTRTEVRKNLSILDALLRKRMNDLGYDPYWQRFMCANWDPVKGCSADCADCDSCTEFQRIRPQYCRMCGGEFLERKEQTYCPKCRAMRKKQAQKKYAVLHARGRL